MTEITRARGGVLQRTRDLPTCLQVLQSKEGVGHLCPPQGLRISSPETFSTGNTWCGAGLGLGRASFLKGSAFTGWVARAPSQPHRGPQCRQGPLAKARRQTGLFAPPLFAEASAVAISIVFQQVKRVSNANHRWE